MFTIFWELTTSKYIRNLGNRWFYYAQHDHRARLDASKQVQLLECVGGEGLIDVY